MSIIGLSCTNQSLEIEDVHEQAIKQNKQDPSIMSVNNEFVDMTSIGNKISTLSLNMLDKKQSCQDCKTLQIDDIQMVQIDQNQANNIKKDDLNDIDIMAYSGTISQEDSNDSIDEPAFSAGGAIFEALVQKDPSLKQVADSKKLSKPKKQNVIKKPIQKIITPKPKIQISEDTLKDEEILGSSSSLSHQIFMKSQESLSLNGEAGRRMSLDTQKENFMDSLLESSLTGKSLHLTSKKKAEKNVNSFVQQQMEEKQIWDQLSGKGAVKQMIELQEEEEKEQIIPNQQIKQQTLLSKPSTKQQLQKTQIAPVKQLIIQKAKKQNANVKQFKSKLKTNLNQNLQKLKIKSPVQISQKLKIKTKQKKSIQIKSDKNLQSPQNNQDSKIKNASLGHVSKTQTQKENIVFKNISLSQKLENKNQSIQLNKSTQHQVISQAILQEKQNNHLNQTQQKNANLTLNNTVCLEIKNHTLAQTQQNTTSLAKSNKSVSISQNLTQVNLIQSNNTQHTISNQSLSLNLTKNSSLSKIKKIDSKNQSIIQVQKAVHNDSLKILPKINVNSQNQTLQQINKSILLNATHFNTTINLVQQKTIKIDQQQKKNLSQNLAKKIQINQKKNDENNVSIEDQISEVFDELHSNPQKFGKEEPTGFIGRHMKKLRDKELEKQRIIQEQEYQQKQFLEQQLYGDSDQSSFSTVQSAQKSQKKKGLMQRFYDKLDKEEKDQQKDIVSQALSDPLYKQNLIRLASKKKGGENLIKKEILPTQEDLLFDALFDQSQ